MQEQVIPSYLYWEYSDDADLQGFVQAYNTMAQQYIDWFNQVGLPVYTGPLIVGSLLDWVMRGLYGMTRPVLPSGNSNVFGPYNTNTYNSIPYDARRVVGPTNFFATTDDVFKRIATWNFLKGDGRTFNVRWLKRRIMRFLVGENGTNPNIDQTYQVSVIFGPNNQVNIRILPGLRTVTGGAFYNQGAYNSTPYNSMQSTFVSFAPFQLAPILQSAIQSGALQLPFQYQYTVSI